MQVGGILTRPKDGLVHVGGYLNPPFGRVGAGREYVNFPSFYCQKWCEIVLKIFKFRKFFACGAGPSKAGRAYHIFMFPPFCLEILGKCNLAMEGGVLVNRKILWEEGGIGTKNFLGGGYLNVSNEIRIFKKKKKNNNMNVMRAHTENWNPTNSCTIRFSFWSVIWFESSGLSFSKKSL